MSASIVFQIVNTIVIPAWLILIFFPKKSWRKPVIYAFAIMMALLYIFYVVNSLGDLELDAFNSLEGIKAMFTSNEAVLTGWIHYLVFDLLIGHWIVGHAQKHGISHYLIIPCLLLCFMFGPAGYCLYMLIKLIKTKTLYEAKI